MTLRALAAGIAAFAGTLGQLVRQAVCPHPVTETEFLLVSGFKFRRCLTCKGSWAEHRDC